MINSLIKHFQNLKALEKLLNVVFIACAVEVNLSISPGDKVLTRPSKRFPIFSRLQPILAPLSSLNFPQVALAVTKMVGVPTKRTSVENPTVNSL